MSEVRELQAIAEERRSATFYVSEFERSFNHWRDHKDRIAKVDRIRKGRFRVRVADGRGGFTFVEEEPKTPNIVDLMLRDRAALAGRMAPSLRVPTPVGASRTKAEKRERIARNYLRVNNMDQMRVYYFRDLYTCGVNYRSVEPDPKTGWPCIRRLNPRHVWPDRAWSPDQGISNAIVVYEQSVQDLRNIYGVDLPGRPEQKAEVIEWHDGSESVRVASVKVNGQRQGVTLARASNPTGMVPVVVGALPEDDLTFAGVFDQMLSVLEAENTIANLLIDSSVDFTTSPMVEWNIENPEDRGKTVLHAKSADAYMRRMPPDSASVQVFAIMDGLRGSARQAASFPEMRSSAIEQSQASAALANTLQGAYSTAIAQDQAIEARALEQTLALCFAFDEKVLDITPDGQAWTKPIEGPPGSKGSESYRPSRDIAGHRDVTVNYGFAAGTDEFNAEIRLYSAVDNQIIARKRARQLSVFVEDEVENEKDLIREALLSSGLTHINALAQAGDFRAGAALAQALNDDIDIYEVLPSLGEFTAPEPGSPTGAFEEAASTSRGGTTNVPGVGALPPFAELQRRVLG